MYLTHDGSAHPFAVWPGLCNIMQPRFCAKRCKTVQTDAVHNYGKLCKPSSAQSSGKQWKQMQYTTEQRNIIQTLQNVSHHYKVQNPHSKAALESGGWDTHMLRYLSIRQMDGTHMLKSHYIGKMDSKHTHTHVIFSPASDTADCAALSTTLRCQLSQNIFSSPHISHSLWHIFLPQFVKDTSAKPPPNVGGHQNPVGQIDNPLSLITEGHFVCTELGFGQKLGCNLTRKLGRRLEK